MPPPKDSEWPRPLTQSEEQTIDLCFSIYTADEAMSLEKLGDVLGYSPGTISQVFSRTYAGRTDRVVRAMAEWCERVKAQDLAIKRPPFMDLDVAVKMFGLCAECRDNRIIGYLCVDKGVGKTMAVEAYAEAHSVSTVLLTCFEGYNSHALLVELARRFGLTWKGSKTTMFPRIVAELKRAGHPLLIIDDCDFLGRAIHIARQLHDQADIGIVLSGTPAFIEWMNAHNSGTIGQALSRVAVRLRIDQITAEDGERLADFYGLSSAASRRAWDACGKNGRRLMHICRRARRFAGDGAVEPEHVDSGLGSLLLNAV